MGKTLKRLAPILLGACAAGLVFSAPALAEEVAPQWTVSSVSRPTYFAEGVREAYVVLVTNTGDAPSSGEITVTDELPLGLSPVPGASGVDELAARDQPGAGQLSCGLRSCTYAGVVAPDDTLILTFPVEVSDGPPSSCDGEVTVPAAAAGCVLNSVRVAGGGALAAGMQTPTFVYANEEEARQQTPFGISPGGSSTALSSMQAGAYADLTVSTAFNTENSAGDTAGNLKDTTYDLPAGFAADFVDTPTCSGAEFLSEECPIPTQVGVTTIDVTGSTVNGPYLEPVYNLAPGAGQLAKIGFTVGGDFHYEGVITLLPDYRAQTVFENATAGPVAVDNVSLTVWGVPAAPIHDPLRWDGISAKVSKSPGHKGGEFGESSTAPRAPFFVNSTSCGEALQSSFTVTSWQHPDESESPPPTGMPFGPLVGCDQLGMHPSLTAEVTSNSAYAPSGFDLQTNIPQTYDNAEGLATSTLKQETVTLPEGITLNPSSGAGLAACSEAQYAEEGTQEKSAEEKSQGHGCPAQSKLATVRISSPSVSEEATGSVYLAEPAPRGGELEPGHNPFNSLLALYLIARIPNRGVLVKVPGRVQLNQTTGQIVTTFGPTPEFDGIPASAGLPPLPFSLATFQFNQGANAPLVTPSTCGEFTVTAELTPYSTPERAPLTPLIPPFSISANCPAGAVPPFAPSLTAGTENPNAGAYSELNILVARNDGEQEITGFSTQLPPGLTGNLRGVEECSGADIEAARRASGVQEEASPSCPAGSEIGHTIADAGVGSVLAQAPGRLYLGGPFEGAPFSVVSVTSAHVGPFDLGTVVVHLPLEINPRTAVVSIPSGPADQIPHIIKGVVVHLREIRVYISREKFMLNPTSCAPMSFSASVIGGGADPTNPAGYDPVTVNDPFRVTACQALAFEPVFRVSTSGRPSKADGASLSVRLTYPSGALGRDANIASTKVELPRQLPSRLTTLQQACTAAQFRANPAGCPAGSVVGHARVLTPILPVALEGPAYFVSNGGEAFPNLIIVLQGDGVTIELVGDTFISKAGITSSTFKAVPDQPFESFELTLPQGPYSALAAYGSLCDPTKTVTVKKNTTVLVHGRKKTVTRKVKQKEASTLAMPTEFVAQNGAVIHQTTTITPIGCPKAKKTKGHPGKHKSSKKNRAAKK